MSLKLELFTALLLVGLDPPAQAHDIYSHLNDANGASCCTELDCRPVPYRVSPTGVQMYVDDDWFYVPNGTIQYRSLPDDTGETRGGHWCGTAIFQQGQRVIHVTHCAILPPNFGSAADRHNE